MKLNENETRLKEQEVKWARFRRLNEMLRDDDEAYDAWRRSVGDIHTRRRLGWEGWRMI